MTRKDRWLLILLPIAILALAWVYASAQTSTPPAQAAPPATPPAPAVPPDRKAYLDAMAIKDPDKKVEALEKFLKDFPDSGGVLSGYMGIFSTLVKSHPDQAARITEAANKVLSKATSDAMRTAYLNMLGTQLFDAGILLDEAEKFVSKGIELNDEQARKSRAPYQATLGRICLKQGKLNEAEKNLKEALAVSPQLSTASLGMAELNEKRGDATKALTFYVNAAATSKLPAANRKQLEALYAKSHEGSTAGLEEMLDAKYLEVNPPPFSVEHYTPSEKRTERVVLTEVFTGSGCPPCVAADLAADLAMQRYGRTLAVLMYHQHIPQPDPMTSNQTSARFKYYAGAGVPTVVIDGATSQVGGGTRDATKSVYDRITKEMEKQMEAASMAQIKLDVLLDGSIVRANAVVNKVAGESPNLKLHIVLAEEKLRYTGENGVRFHPMVVRSIAGPESGGQGFPITSKDSQTFAWDFKLDAISAEIKKNLDDYEKGRTDGYTFNEKKYEINPKDLIVVAFVQDEKTKAIFQSIQVKVNAKTDPQ